MGRGLWWANPQTPPPPAPALLPSLTLCLRLPVSMYGIVLYKTFDFGQFLDPPVSGDQINTIENTTVCNHWRELRQTIPETVWNTTDNRLSEVVFKVRWFACLVASEPLQNFVVIRNIIML